MKNLNHTSEFDEFSLEYGEPMTAEYLINYVLDGAKFQKKLGFPADAVEMLELLKKMYEKQLRFALAQEGYQNEKYIK